MALIILIKREKTMLKDRTEYKKYTKKRMGYQYRPTMNPRLKVKNILLILSGVILAMLGLAFIGIGIQSLIN